MATTGDGEAVAGAAEQKRLLEPTFALAGKRVTLRKRLPASEGGTIYKLLGDGDMRDMLSYAPFLALLIEAWEFDGDPRDAASYRDLDTITELMPLIGEVSRRWAARVEAANPKA